MSEQEHTKDCKWHKDWHACNCGAFDKTLSKEAIDFLHPAESGWTTIHTGPTLKMPTFKTEATGADSIREGIDQEILEKLQQDAVILEEAAIADDLKRQMEAGCVMPQIYTPLQVTNLFEKK